MLSDFEVREAIHVAILRERERRGLSTNKELADALGIPVKHLSHWRNGQFTRLDRALVELLIRSQNTPQITVEIP